jgi:molecular chaperone HscB
VQLAAGEPQPIVQTMNASNSAATARDGIVTPFALGDDDFAVLGLQRRHAVDLEMLDERRRVLQAKVHPDRFAASDAATQRQAMQLSMRVNEAWRRLRHPVQRAAYLCGLMGVPVDAERNTAMPRDFLMQQMQWREALDDASSAQALEGLRAQVANDESRLLERVRQRLDVDGDAKAAAEDVRALMFLGKFRADVEHRIEDAP